MVGRGCLTALSQSQTTLYGVEQLDNWARSETGLKLSLGMAETCL
jgi:hypothetical protein